jgi:serine/threonine-protein kinase
MADVRIEIEEAFTEPVAVRDASIGFQRTNKTLWSALAAVSVIAVGVAIAAYFLRPQSPRSVTKLLVDVQPAEWLGGGYLSTKLVDFQLGRTAFTLSPDGRQIVFGGGDSEGYRLYLRRMDETEAEPITGTDGGVAPFFSPDGQWIGFWSEGKLRRIGLNGGTPLDICDTVSPLYAPKGASWSPDDTIVYHHLRKGVMAVQADGGEPKAITTLESGEVDHHLPQILPGGDALLFTARKRSWGNWETAEVVAQVLETGERKVLIENGADARYVPTGHLVFARMGTLMAVPFDPKRLEVTGAPVGVIAGIYQSVNHRNSGNDSGSAQFSFSSTGTFAYVGGGILPDPDGSLVWVGRQGAVEPIPAPAAPYSTPRISPDGRRLAVARGGLESDVWIYDIERKTSTRLTIDDHSSDFFAIWTQNGSHITFSSDRMGFPGIWQMPADGSGSPERLTTIDLAAPASWSPDGKVLAFVRFAQPGQRAQNDIWVVPDQGEPKPFIESPFHEGWPAFSPDGRWLAYASDRSGRGEVYVTPYPGPGPTYQISSDGGSEPVWSRSGKELFYRGPTNRDWVSAVMVVDITTEPKFGAGSPRLLFEGNYERNAVTPQYDVTADGQKFVMDLGGTPPVEPVTHIHIVLNWFEELERLAPIEN